MNDMTIIENPNGNLAKAEEICRYIATRRGELLASVNAVSVTAENWNDPQTKAAVEELTEAVEDLRERGKRLVRDVVAATEAQRVLTQIDSRLWSYSTKADPNCAYAVLSAALKELKAKIAAFKEAALPPAPTHCYAMQFDVTDAGLKKILAAVAKEAGTQYRVWHVEGDKARKDAEAFFAKIGWTAAK